jgi:hypothetical protein
MGMSSNAKKNTHVPYISSQNLCDFFFFFFFDMSVQEERKEIRTSNFRFI